VLPAKKFNGKEEPDPLNKEQQCTTSKKDGKLLRVQKYIEGTVIV
jgi:hypothetical protein